GVTYKAWDLRIGDDFPVVIKVPNLSAHNKKNRSQLIDLFKKEAKLLAAVSRTPHPHIVQITDSFEEEGIPCLVMDFVSGTNLQDLVEEKGRLSEEKAIAYMKDIGSALEFCHKKGIIHRDIKPANIMVRDDDERVMLIDFGIARETGGETMTTSFTRLYAPWEQINRSVAEDLKGKEGAKKWRQSPTVDIYACAGSLYYLVTGDFI
ncbi:MAG: serine/threonine protein kinase, partial [Prochloron sp. SP5CPC1]|nr:serine/threonine protein kinase [Candidatus Paraprochloron terpiosi SP5CPC1]